MKLNRIVRAIGTALLLVAALSFDTVLPPQLLSRAWAAEQPKRGGTLRYAHGADILHFDPAALATGNNPMVNQVYDTLTRYDGDLKAQPVLAERWEFADGGKTLTLYLRQGVSFHSGRPLTAEDVVASIKHYQDPKIGANIHSLSRLVSETSAADKYKVVLKMERAAPAIFDFLDLAFIISKDAIPTVKQKPDGTGPFKLAEWLPGDRARLVRNERYWKPNLPYLDTVELVVIRDPEAMLTALETGTVDVVEDPPYRDLNRLMANKALATVRAPAASQNIALTFNTRRKPFDHALVRQAINYALDRKRIVETFFAGHSQVWCMPWPPTSLAYDAKLNASCEYNLEQAKSLLAKAGYPNGFETTMLVSPRWLPGSDVTAQILQADLAKIGVKVQLIEQEQAKARADMLAGRFDMVGHVYLRANKDPAALFGTTLYFRPDNPASGYSPPEYRKLVMDAASTMDVAQRRKLYAEINRILATAVPVVTIAPFRRPFTMWTAVRDFSVTLDSFAELGRTWISK